MLRNESIGKVGQYFHCEVLPYGDLMLKVTNGDKTKCMVFDKWPKQKVPRAILENSIEELAEEAKCRCTADIKKWADIAASRVDWIQ